MSILTAAEFIAQGTTAGAIMSIASVHSGAAADRLRRTAKEVSSITGQSLQIPGSVNSPRYYSNDNRRPGKKKVA